MSEGSGQDTRRRHAPLDRVARLHATPHRTVYAFAGAGSLALAWLHAVGGSSRTVLEAHDHYHAASLRDALGAEVGADVGASVSSRVAEGLAVASRTRARRLVVDDDPPGPTFGLGLTATIATDRRKRGEHRVELASADALGVAGTSFVLAKGARDRAGEEDVVGRWLLAAAAQASGLLGWAGPSLRDDEPVAHRFRPSSAFQAFLDDPDALLALGTAGRPIPVAEDESPPALVSGSFHPMHEGHRRLAEAAEAHLGRPAWFEMPLANADKDAVAPAEARARAAQAYGVRRLLLTHVPLFAEKAERLPGCVFVVGVDTARRVLAPRFYGGEDGLANALARIRAAGARFLVAGRAGDEGFRTLADLEVPETFGDLFEALPSFRVDLSSTELRADWPSTADP